MQEEKTADQGKEKHVPVVEKNPTGILVRIGAIPYPEEEKHYPERVEVRSGENVYIRYLKPGENPKRSSAVLT